MWSALRKKRDHFHARDHEAGTYKKGVFLAFYCAVITRAEADYRRGINGSVDLMRFVHERKNGSDVNATDG